MVDDDLGPGDFSTRGLPTVRRGYEKKAVDALVAGAFARWTELHRRYTDLLEELGKAGGVEQLGRDLGAVAREVDQILAASDEAATGLRERAWEAATRLEEESKHEAETRVAEAEEQARRLVAEAEEQAFGARRDAWEAGTALLEEAMEKSAVLLAEAEEQVLIIRAEGEQEAHRRLAQGRKDADDLIRSARFEADRRLAATSELIREILEAVAEGGPGWDEERRTRLLAEIDLLRTGRSIEEIAVVPSGSPAPGEERLSYGDLDPQEPGLSEALAAEVERLRDVVLASSERDVSRTAGEPPGPADIESLFDSLRTGSAAEVGVEAAPDAPAPVARRDRTVIPAYNTGLREVKRRLVDLQERALEALASGGSPPSPQEIAAELAPLLESVVQRAAAAGFATGRATVAVDGPPEAGDRPTRLVERMANDLASQVRSAGSSSGDGQEQTAAAVSRVFRTWRTDQAERWVRTVAYAAYNDALLAALARGGVASVRGVAYGAPCDACPGPARLEWAPGESPPDGAGVPPVGVDCLCTFEAVEESQGPGAKGREPRTKDQEPGTPLAS